MTFEQWLQSRLTAHGYPVGIIDEKIGSITISALKAFQKAKGLPVTGAGDEKTVAALRLSSTAQTPLTKSPRLYKAGNPQSGTTHAHR